MLRKGVLFAVLAGVVALIVLDEPQREEAPRATAGAPAAQAKPLALELGIPERAGLGKPRGAIFAAPVAPKPAPVVVAAVAPSAPPLPYRFAGVVRQGEETQHLLARGDVVFPIKEGETLDGAYRVASIGAQRIELVYVPLGITERIAVTSTLDASPARREPVAASSAPAAQRAPAASAAASDTASLRWVGPEQVRAGSSVSVALRLTYGGALRAAPMQLRFEPGVLEALHVRPGRFLNRGQFSYRVNAEGSIFVGASAAGAAPGADAELVVVTFKPVKAGATAGLSMAALSLQGPAGSPVAYAQLADYRAPIVP